LLLLLLLLQVTIGDQQVHVGGMCKGSGMIHPNMATMLGIVTCDAAVEPEVWRGMLRRACDASFNAVSAGLKQAGRWTRVRVQAQMMMRQVFAAIRH
jgi:glutamate N-acetyltransferase/amino-acid N-acetyltransferase